MWISSEEYNKIKKILPIPCVDLIIRNEKGEILLIKRKNEPAKGLWWFPGGRVMLGESRKNAAIRKLKEECGIIANQTLEWKSCDIFLYDHEESYNSHGISTLFIFDVTNQSIELDEQSSDYSWKTIDNWIEIISNDFISTTLKELAQWMK